MTKVTKREVVPIQAMKANKRRRVAAVLILKLGTTCRWVSYFTFRPL
jgi:hypothetical protein